jgi:nucleoside-diphosphate-sugar epimerase
VSVRALVVGGTGPTGPYVVNGLIARGYEVTILHTGRHESNENPTEVVHIHTDPFDSEATGQALGRQHFDLGVVMYGRLRDLAPLLIGRVDRLITIGGVGAVRGWVDPDDLFPASMTVPAPIDAPLAPPNEPIGKIRRIVETEQAVFEHHPGAIHLRYPMLYGPRQLLPREWPFIKRALDRRPRLVLADGGLTLKSAAYVENAAHAVMCAVDHFEAGSGQIFNVTDDRALTLRQIAEVVADELDHQFEFISMPYELAVPARPLVMHWSSGHRVVNTEPLRRVLDYHDLVRPEEGLRRTVRWLVGHPPSDQASASRLQDPFDYKAEDQLIDRWLATVAGFEPVSFSSEPGFGGAYYGRTPNPATGTSRMEQIERRP